MAYDVNKRYRVGIKKPSVVYRGFNTNQDWEEGRRIRTGRIYKDHSKRLFYIKPKDNLTARISNVKLAELAREIDPKLATINLFGEGDLTLSADICVENEAVTHTRPFDPVYNDGPRPPFWEKLKLGNAPDVFQNLDLAKSLESATNSCFQTQEFVDAFAEQWLLAYEVGIGDMFGFNNCPIVAVGKPEDNKFRCGKMFDFDIGIYTWEDPAFGEISKKVFPFLEMPINTNNVDWLKQNAPRATDNFMNNLSNVRPKLGKIFDFKPLARTVKMPKKHNFGVFKEGFDMYGKMCAARYDNRFARMAYCMEGRKW